jgi:hypothetical protein
MKKLYYKLQDFYKKVTGRYTYRAYSPAESICEFIASILTDYKEGCKSYTSKQELKEIDNIIHGFKNWTIDDFDFGKDYSKANLRKYIRLNEKKNADLQKSIELLAKGFNRLW